MNYDYIRENTRRILETLPPHVTLVAAAKTRRPEEVHAAIEAGITAVGHNYVQEADHMIQTIGYRVRWHLIGHLQRNKASKAASLFDCVETIDSWRIAQVLDRHCKDLGKVLPVLIEVNSGQESSKTGVLPEVVEDLARRMAALENLRLEGLMTMGPRFGNPADAHPYFQLTKALFDQLAEAKIPNTEMQTLSMGMSNSYQVAIEEGANMIRLGTILFGNRPE